MSTMIIRRWRKHRDHTQTRKCPSSSMICILCVFQSCQNELSHCRLSVISATCHEILRLETLFHCNLFAYVRDTLKQTTHTIRRPLIISIQVILFDSCLRDLLSSSLARAHAFRVHFSDYFSVQQKEVTKTTFCAK